MHLAFFYALTPLQRSMKYADGDIFLKLADKVLEYILYLNF